MHSTRTLIGVVILLILAGLVRSASGQSITSCVLFEEEAGLVVMEAESVLPRDSWGLRNDVADALGDGYYEWKHGDNRQDIDAAGSGILTYTFSVDLAGTYRFILRSSSPDNTEHNDVWVRFPDKPATGIRQSGQGSIDIPQNSWFKVYQNTSGQEWKWDARTVDFDPHSIFVTFEEPGTYAVELSGRSTLFKIDRLVLYHEQVTFADATLSSNAESACAETVTLPLRPPDEPVDLQPGIAYAYYEGDWVTLPDFTALTPVETGSVQGFDISLNQREDDFGFLFEGYVEAPTDGLYTFFTLSNAGSQLFIGDELVVDNDSSHAAQERSGFIALAAGFHEISVLYFEDFFSQTLAVSWTPPGSGRDVLGEGSLFYNPDTIRPTNVSDERPSPRSIRLYPNYPDPFTSSTTLAFDLATASSVRLSLYNASGQLVDVLLDGVRPAGRHEATVDLSTLRSGLYIYRLETRSETLSGTMTLVK